MIIIMKNQNIFQFLNDKYFLNKNRNLKIKKRWVSGCRSAVQ